MILSEFKPQNSLYYIGGKILQLIDEKSNASDDLLSFVDGFKFSDLFIYLHKYIKVNINSFILALDWLYLINMIEIDSSGNIKKCISNRSKLLITPLVK